ncbi:head completion/stabilization protein, partial [Klebsiella pneumoniae]|uniref:head completion/stabilization protein n=1 Tax=Klebsiella pneumoniae TaxID=573 RepID=UPI003967F62C
ERRGEDNKTGQAETNAELFLWREQQIGGGFSKLDDVPADDLDGESVRVFYYLRAVTSMATATLYERSLGVFCMSHSR